MPDLAAGEFRTAGQVLRLVNGASRRATMMRCPPLQEGRRRVRVRDVPRALQDSALDSSSVQFQSLTVTSIGRISTPWFIASRTICAGASKPSAASRAARRRTRRVRALEP